MPQILIADEMDLVTDGARLALQDKPDWIVTGEYHTLTDAIQHLETVGVDVIICGDQIDPLYNAFHLVDRLQSTAPHAPVVLIGTIMDGKLLSELFDSGVHGYLHRGDPLRECLPTAIRTVLKGTLYLSPSASAAYLTAMQTHERHPNLDEEARLVLQLLAQGYTVGEIAVQLGIPLRRVYWVREKLRRRFGATTNEHLIRRSTGEGFTPING